MDYINLSNEELLKKLNDYKLEHLALKNIMLKHLDNLIVIESEYNKLNEFIKGRVNYNG